MLNCYRQTPNDPPRSTINEEPEVVPIVEAPTDAKGGKKAAKAPKPKP